MRLPTLPAVSVDEVVVSTGSKQSLYNACVALFGPGDEVLIPTPSWTSYYEMVSLARAEAVAVHADPGRGFKVTPEELVNYATPRTKGLMLNSPCNPTGSVYDASELRGLLALAADRGWWVITDEIYARIAYEKPAPRTLEVAPDRERLVVVDGVAKAYAMTGWRIGWTISSAPLAKLMTGFQSHTTSNAATVSQHAALAALTQVDAADRAISEMVEEFRVRRDAALEVLSADSAIRVVRPDGAFYLYVEAPGADRDPAAGDTFAAHLLEAHNVAVVPGAAFLTPGWVRLSYAAARPLVIEAAKRLVAAHRERRSE